MYSLLISVHVGLAFDATRYSVSLSTVNSMSPFLYMIYASGLDVQYLWKCVKNLAVACVTSFAAVHS